MMSGLRVRAQGDREQPEDQDHGQDEPDPQAADGFLLRLLRASERIEHARELREHLGQDAFTQIRDEGQRRCDLGVDRCGHVHGPATVDAPDRGEAAARLHQRHLAEGHLPAARRADAHGLEVAERPPLLAGGSGP